MSTVMTAAGKATIYRRGEFMGNISKTEVAEVRFGRGKYAQYESSPKVEFRKARQRNWRGYAEGYQPSTLILEGWGHPEPEAMYPEVPADADGVVSVMSRYSSHDPGWQRDFDAMMNAYLEKSGAKVLADYRGVNTHDALPEPVST